MIITPPVMLSAGAFIKAPKPTEMVNCAICGSEFERLVKKHNPKKYCYSKRCKKILRLGYDKPFGFESAPNKPSVFRADIDYYGHPN